MFSFIAPTFNSFIYQPLYNALAFLVSVVPGADVGIAIIILTIIIKLILFPLSFSAVKTQVAMKEIDPQLKQLRKDLANNKEELAKKTMALFKDKKVNPFASIFLILIQLPIILGLYFVFRSGGTGVAFDPSVLYSFVTAPMNASFTFLGFINLTGRSIVLALLVAVTQYFASKMMMPKAPESPDGEQSFKNDLAKSMHIQMRYVFPVVIGVIAYVISGAVALYFVVSNLFTIGQELYVKKHRNGQVTS